MRFIVLFILLFATQVHAAILIESPNGVLVSGPTTMAAACAQSNPIHITSALTSAFSNISSATVHGCNSPIVIHPGGSLGNTTNFNINGPFSAGNYQVFAGNGTVTGLKEAKPEWWGPGVDTLNKAARAVSMNGTVYLSKAVYQVTSLNLSTAASGYNQSLKIIGAGPGSYTGAPSIVQGTVNGAVIVDTIGTNNLVLQDFQIQTAGGITAQTGLLLARSTVSPNSNHHKIDNVSIYGSFSLAAAISIASESNTWTKPLFYNTNASANYQSFWTGTYNDVGVVSTNGTIQNGPNTDNTMIHPEFYGPYNNANLSTFLGNGEYKLITPFFVTGGGTGGNLITVTPHTGDFVAGGLTIEEPLFEGTSPTIINLLCIGGSLNYFNAINVKSGYYNIYGGTIPIINYNNTGGNQAILQDSTITKGKFNPSSIASINLYVSAFNNIDLLSTNVTSTITINNYQQSSNLLATILNLGSVSVNSNGTSYGPVAPYSGTWPLGHTVINNGTAPVFAWRSVASGTPGTWRAQGSEATSIPTKGVWTVGDRIVNSGTTGGWVATVAGGVYSTTRANTSVYSIGTWALWSTGTTVWECTTAGTSAGSAPSIVGKSVGDTVTDGTVVWTQRAATVATLTVQAGL